MIKSEFIKAVEKLIDPMAVGSLHFIQSFSKLLPKNVQKKLVKSSAQKIPYMGFVVEPYAFFLCYEINDMNQAMSLLPDGFELLKTSIFDYDEPKYYGIISCFRSHTSAFWGTRAECYLIAKDKNTGLVSWIIVDYDSDTISYDNYSGLKSPNATAVHTTDYNGQLYVDITQNNNLRRLNFTADLNNAKVCKLDQGLWLEGNLSIGYGKLLSHNKADIFSLKFIPDEVSSALEIPLTSLNIIENSWFKGLFKETPSKLVCFPYAQHFISDSPGTSSKLRTKDELVKSINQLDFSSIKTMSAKSFVKAMTVGSTISMLIIVVLIILLIIK